MQVRLNDKLVGYANIGVSRLNKSSIVIQKRNRGEILPGPYTSSSPRFFQSEEVEHVCLTVKWMVWTISAESYDIELGMRLEEWGVSRDQVVSSYNILTDNYNIRFPTLDVSLLDYEDIFDFDWFEPVAVGPLDESCPTPFAYGKVFTGGDYMARPR